MIKGYKRPGEFSSEFEVFLMERDKKVMAQATKHESEVDRLLAQYSLEFKLNPYRIVKKGTEQVVQRGPEFDLRHPTLAKNQKTVTIS
jgi:hypothetical protein